MKFVSKECFSLKCPCQSINLLTHFWNKSQNELCKFSKFDLFMEGKWGVGVVLGVRGEGVEQVIHTKFGHLREESRFNCIHLTLWHVKLIMTFTEQPMYSSKLLYSISVWMSYKGCIDLFNLAKIQGLVFSIMAFAYYWLHLVNGTFACYHCVS